MNRGIASAGERPKRQNAFIGLFDTPLQRDWAFWATVGWGFLSCVSLTFGKNSHTNLSRWENAVFGTITLTVLFAVILTLIRLGFRKWKQKYRSIIIENVPPTPIKKAKLFESEELGRPTNKQDSVASPRPASQESPDVVIRHAIVGSVVEDNFPAFEFTRSHLQHPIARIVRAVQSATDSRHKYEQVLSAGEAIAMCLGCSVMASSNLVNKDMPAFRDLRSALLGRGITTGHWVAAIDAIGSSTYGSSEPLPGLTEALRRGKRGSGLIAELKGLIKERNLWAHHGGPRTTAEADLRLKETLPALESALSRCRFLSEIPWLQTKACSYRRREGDFLVTGALVMGDHPDLSPTTFISPVPLANGTIYLMNCERPFDLTPFVVSRYCEVCRQSEVFFADRLDNAKGAVLKNIASGHVTYDATLRDEIQKSFV